MNHLSKTNVLGLIVACVDDAAADGGHYVHAVCDVCECVGLTAEYGGLP